MTILRFNYSTLLKRSKNLSYREQITKMTVVLMTFLKENQLLAFEPFNDDGSVKEDLVIQSTDLTDEGNVLFKEYFPKWSAYIDRGGEIENTKILNDGLKKITAK